MKDSKWLSLIIRYFGYVLAGRRYQTFGQIRFRMKLWYLTSRITRWLLHVLFLVLISSLLKKQVPIENLLCLFSNFVDSPPSSGETESSSSTTIIAGSSHTNSVQVGQEAELPPIISQFHYNMDYPLPELINKEIELYARIRNLEARQIEQLPPQLNEGEYEQLVRGFLNQVRTPNEFRSRVNIELFDIRVLELKADLQDLVFNLFLNEPDAQLIPLLRESPFREQNLRPEILDYLTFQLERVGLADSHPRDPLGKVLLETFLREMLTSLQQQGRNSFLYTEWIQYFRRGGGG